MCVLKSIPGISVAGDLRKPGLCYTLGTIQKMVPLDLHSNITLFFAFIQKYENSVNIMIIHNVPQILVISLRRYLA